MDSGQPLTWTQRKREEEKAEREVIRKAIEAENAFVAFLMRQCKLSEEEARQFYNEYFFPNAKNNKKSNKAKSTCRRRQPSINR